MIDIDRLQAMTNEQLANELDAMFERAVAKKLKGPRDMADLVSLVPLLTLRLRQKDDYIAIPRLD